MRPRALRSRHCPRDRWNRLPIYFLYQDEIEIISEIDGEIEAVTKDGDDAVIAVNLKGVYLCGQACAKVMSEKKYGKIINPKSYSPFL